MPRNPFDQLGDETIDLHHLAGRDDGVVYNFTPADETDSGDGGEWYNSNVESDFIEDDGTPITIRLDKGTQNLTQGPAGQDLEGDVMIYVDPNEADFTAGTETDDRASEVVDTRDGARYRVEKLIDDHGGVLTLDASRMGPSA